MDDEPDTLITADREFIEGMRGASLPDLDTMLRWQCGEPWRRMAVLRAMARRRGERMPAVDDVMI